MKKVVIVGGGFAGCRIAKLLQNTFSVTLIDPKDHFEFTPSVLRTIVDAGVRYRLQIPYKRSLKGVKIVKGKVSEVCKKHVVVGKVTMPFDYLCLCTGSEYGISLRCADTVNGSDSAALAKNKIKYDSASRIIVVGGGLVGVELAGEMCDDNKLVTIVHSKDRLIERNPIKASKYAADFFKRKNADIVYGEYVVGREKGNFVTLGGKRIRGDLAFVCTGTRPNSSMLNKHFAKSLDEKGSVIVDPYLLVMGSDNIFAPGDINNMQIEKTAQNAKKQAEIVARNILALENREKLTVYEPEVNPIIISLGKREGILVWGERVLTGKVPAILKKAVEVKEMSAMR